MNLGKLSPEDIEQIKSRIASGESLQSIGTDYHVSKQTIWNVKQGKYSVAFRSGTVPKRTPKTQQSFADLPADEIADRVEQDMRTAARKWKRTHHGKRANVHDAATTTAALYLQKHHELYFREDRQAMRDAHGDWMDMMREWFILTVEGKKTHV